MNNNEISIRNASLIGGFSLLAISILAPVGHFGIIQNLIVPGDATATVNKIVASEGLFRIGISFLLLNAVLDLVAAWALYIVLKPVNRNISLLSAWFRMVYTAILFIALSNFMNVLQILQDADYRAVFEAEQMHAHVMMYINNYENVWNLGYILFGLHLISLGYLLFKSDYFPSFLGSLVMISGFGYLIDHLP